MSLFDFFPSRTVALALSVLPLASRAFDLKQTDEWIYEKLGQKTKERGTLEEFREVIVTAKAFLNACWAFLHK